jgi:hypothetical protein
VRGTENDPLACPAGTANVTVVVAPAPGTLVVEEEGVVEVEVGLEADRPVVVVGPPAVWRGALEQLAAAIAKAIRATPVVAPPFLAERRGRL